MPIIDMTGVQSGFDPLPADNYRVKLVDFENGVGRESNNALVKIEVQLTDPPDPKYKNRKLWRTHTFTPESLPFLRETLMAFGAEPKQIAGSFDSDVVLESLKGNEAMAQVARREYADPNDRNDEGEPIVKIQNDIKKFKPLTLAQR